MKTHIALATDGHAERAMAKHLDTDLHPRRSADMLGLYLTEDLSHLLHIQLTRQHDDISKLRIELQGFNIGDIQLCGEMHLLPHLITIGHHRHIRGNDGRDASLLGGIDDLMHQGNVLAVDNRIDGEITLDAMLITQSGNLAEVVDGERRGRMCPHVQLLNTKVDAVGSSLNGSHQ